MRIKHEGEGKPSSKYEKLKGLNILIATPTRDSRCSMHYAASLAETVLLLYQNGIASAIAKTDNSCFVCLSRNLILKQFDDHQEFTHVLMIDDDMAWSPKSILEMLLKNKPFIAAAGRKKTMEMQFAGEMIIKDGNPVGKLGEEEEDVILNMKRIGSAFSLMNREALEILKQKHPDHKNKGLGHVFYQLKYDDKGLITEDYYFCRLLKKAGIDVWCYPNVTMGHLGSYDYKGNYFDFLKKCKEKENEMLVEVPKKINEYTPEEIIPNKLIEGGVDMDSVERMRELVSQQAKQQYEH